ncbi:MAG: hypothetical protein EOO77_32345 [Oxalobacteraceae bacterium]|nr:MAG: hypothetical protein EOO77_32345 [Oxalobacteraceae bacterium]
MTKIRFAFMDGREEKIMRLRHITANHYGIIADQEVEAESAEALTRSSEDRSLCIAPVGTPAHEVTAILARVMTSITKEGEHNVEIGALDPAMDCMILMRGIAKKIEEINRTEETGLPNAVDGLRRLCNEEISRASMAAYRPSPCADIINPDVPFRRVNALLRACDRVFAEMPR